MTSADVFLRNGATPTPGSLFANPALGAFYERVLRHAEAAGSSREMQIEAALAYWYDGAVAEAIDRFCRGTEALDVSGRRHRGLLTADDLAGWRPPLERPLNVAHQGFTVFKPYLAFGTPGGDQQEQWSLLLWLIHAIHRRPLQRAIETAAFHTDHMISSFWPRELALGTLTLESRFPTATVKELQRRGHITTIGSAWSEGRLSACSYERITDGAMLRAGANPRGMQGYAVVR